MKILEKAVIFNTPVKQVTRKIMGCMVKAISALNFQINCRISSTGKKLNLPALNPLKEDLQQLGTVH